MEGLGDGWYEGLGDGWYEGLGDGWYEGLGDGWYEGLCEGVYFCVGYEGLGRLAGLLYDGLGLLAGLLYDGLGRLLGRLLKLLPKPSDNEIVTHSTNINTNVLDKIFILRFFYASNVYTLCNTTKKNEFRGVCFFQLKNQHVKYTNDR